MVNLLKISLILFFLFFLLFFLLFFFTTLFTTIRSRGSVQRFLKRERKTKNEITDYMIKQKQIFMSRLLVLKAASIIFFLYFFIEILIGTIGFFNVWIISGVKNPPFSVIAMYEFSIKSLITIVASMIAVISYFIFSWIFQKRMLTLEKLKNEL